MAHLQKTITKSTLNLCSLKLFPSFSFDRDAGLVKGKRIMMFVSMVNSRFYVHVFPLVKLPLQKLLLFLIIDEE